MNIRVIVALGVMTVLLAAAFVVPVEGKPVSQNAGGNDAVSSGVTLMSAAETYAYWTPARMAEANANVSNMPELTLTGPQPALPPSGPLPLGPGQFIPGNPPAQP